MAHDKDKKNQVRKSYVFDGLSLASCAMLADVSYSTAQRWKNVAKDNDDDWDKLKAANTLAGSDLEDIGRQILTDFIVQFKSTMDMIREDETLTASQRVELLTSLSDSYNKAIAANKKIMPETNKLAVALQVVELLSKYIAEHKPELLTAFMEVLEPFGEVLDKELK